MKRRLEKVIAITCIVLGLGLFVTACWLQFSNNVYACQWGFMCEYDEGQTTPHVTMPAKLVLLLYGFMTALAGSLLLVGKSEEV